MIRSKPVVMALLASAVFVSIAFALSPRPRYATPMTWPPRPEQIVNLQGEAVTIPPGSGLAVYTVPFDRWLVVTDKFISGQSGFPGSLGIELVEEKAGVLTVKCPGTLNRQTAITSPHQVLMTGLAFQPRSVVVLRNPDPLNTSTVQAYLLGGYLVEL